MSANTCRVSVIAATHNRGPLLRKNIESILSQSFQDFEVIYADDASSDDTPAILAEYAANSQGRLRHVRTDHGGPGVARNAAAREAKGELLLITDDDVIAPPDWIAGMVRLYETAQGDALCGGFAPTKDNNRIGRYLYHRTQIGFGKRPRPVKVAPMMNFLIPRALFQQIGGFSTQDSLINEDWEFCWRLTAAGKAIQYDPNVQVLHHYQSTWPQALRRVTLPGYHSARMYAAQPGGIPAFIARATGKFLLSPFWALRYFPLDLYPMALYMEWRFFKARLQGIHHHLTQNPNVPPQN